MNENRIIELWLRSAGGERLSEAEQREVVEALEKDFGLRSRLLRNDQIEGLLHSFGWKDGDGDVFERSFLERLSAERDATRFIKKVESRMDILSAGPRRLTTRRSFTRCRSAGPGPMRPLVIAAAAIFGVILLYSLTSTPDLPAPRTTAETRRKAVLAEAEARRQEVERRIREIEKKRTLLAQVRPPQDETLEAHERRQKELLTLDVDREQIERDLQIAVARSKAAQAEATKQVEAPVPPPSPRVERTTQTALAEIVEVAGEAYLVTKEGRMPAVAGSSLLPERGLETGKGAGRVVLQFPDGSRVECGADTLLSELRTDSGKRFSVARGSVRAVAAKQPKDAPMVFATPHGQMTVVGTILRFVVKPDPKKGTRLEVDEGMVRIKNLAGKEIPVNAGFYAVAASDHEMTAKPIPTAAAALLEERGEVTINFGPEGLQLPEGVVNDSGEEFDPIRGFGWRGPKEGQAIPGATWIDGSGSRKPAYSGRYASQVWKAPDILRGTAVVGGWTNHTESWRIAIPNGRYLVSVMAGYTEEDGWEQGPHHVRIEGKLVLDAVMTRKGVPALKELVPVEVKDGFLIMVIGGHQTTKKGTSEVSSTRINYLVIKRAAN